MEILGEGRITFTAEFKVFAANKNRFIRAFRLASTAINAFIRDLKGHFQIPPTDLMVTIAVAGRILAWFSFCAHYFCRDPKFSADGIICKYPHERRPSALGAVSGANWRKMKRADADSDPDSDADFFAPASIVRGETGLE
jgi:hypothetical protein